MWQACGPLQPRYESPPRFVRRKDITFNDQEETTSADFLKAAVFHTTLPDDREPSPVTIAPTKSPASVQMYL